MGSGGRRRGLLAALAVGLWLGVTLPGAAVAVLQLSFGDLDCLAPGSDSNYGRKDWSVAPPGPRCVWTRELNGFVAEDEPSGLWSVWLVAVAASGLVAVWSVLAVGAGGRLGTCRRR